ncbi:MAG: histidine phosphatase family protein [Desulfarculaceae bacterium]|nr:histidine phosphatase family protein [Desulfarculaceae bacterium]MCF8071593.1 histidine phosphatase family protein [Desulfarculaceae bacterium]MCF8102408.1 histidine phosphatase family protein [Desulfarculaceae bacterium]MCF8114872.1 histidine phosphatase family protein [Desulfarculaceae bacterium]
MIYLLRHGEIPQSKPRRMVGQADLPLTELGRAQAVWWRDELAGHEFREVVCSDLRRCVDTAGIVANGRPVRQDPLWREVSLGDWTGLTPDEIKQRFPGEWERRGTNLGDHRTGGGESFAQVAARALPALEALAGPKGDALVISHSGVMRALVCVVLGMPLGRLLSLDIAYAGLCLLDRQPTRWVLAGLNLRPGV